MVDYSIIICTYNPDFRLLERCLNAVALLDRSDLVIEVIVVDNNSTVPAEQWEPIINCGHRIPNFKITRELKQGLLFARIHGAKQATGNFIVFFDDDNEPFEDYLVQLHELVTTHPNVAAWGPGNVWVDFIDDIDNSLRNFALPLFQERHEKHIMYACVRSAHTCYPYGTGLAISSRCIERYIKRVASHELSLVGRTGQVLSSGEDTQMVLCCVDMGYAAGVSPTLKVNHIIPSKRANYAYIKKLTWGTLITYDLSIKQVFPEYVVNSGKQVKPDWKINIKVLTRYLKVLLFGKQHQRLTLIYDLALMSSPYLAMNKNLPRSIKWVAKKLGVAG